MTIVAELPAEGNPLNEANLLHTLTSASSNQQQQVRAGTAQLQAWETKEQYFSLLQEAFIQTTLPTEIRLLAIIQLKNGIDKYWRKSASNAIPTEERQKIRSRLLSSGINEPRDTLANQNAIVTAKVARHDFPSQWPDLVKDLINLLSASTQPSTPPKQLSRILLITHHVIKELATIRLQRARATLFAVTPSLFTVLRQLYLFKMQQWQDILRNSYSEFSLQAVNDMSDNERVLKIARRLVIAGYEFPHRDQDICQWWQTTHSHTQFFLQLLHHPQVHQAYITSVGHQIKQLAKFHLDMIRDHPTSFALLPEAVALVRTYWSSAVALRKRQLTSPEELTEEMNLIYETFNLRALLILRGCFKTVHASSQQLKYRNSAGLDEPPKAKEILKSELLVDDFLMELCNKLIDVFFVYTELDIEIFTTEPEEWEMREGSGGDIHERSVKPCAERLFLEIALNYKDLIMQPLLMKLGAMCSPQTEDVRIKDAAYSALGVAAPILHNSLDFNSFFVNSIIPELQKRQPEHSILRRRIALVLAQWISLDISEANRPLVYQVYQHLLDKTVQENDQVVRITAGKQFSDIVFAWEFDPTQFLQYGAAILTQLVDLIQEVELVETKLALLTTVGAMVEAMNRHIQAFSDQIVTLLPRLWNENSQENLMKQAIVSILFKLVKALGSDSGPIHTMMLPTIRSALEPGSETQLYLLDDSLDLWAAIVKQSPTPSRPEALSPDLPSMLPLLYPVYEMELDYMRKALKITESYIHLAPSYVAQDNMRLDLLRALTSLLKVRKPDIIDIVADNVELLVRAAEAMGGSKAVGLMVDSMLQSNFMSHILESLHSDWATHQTAGPNRKEPPADWRNETNYFCILARIILVSPQLFYSVAEQWAQAQQKNVREEIPNLVDEWLNHMDAVGTPGKAKLLCLALTKLLESGEGWVLERLQGLMTMWTSIVLDLRDGDDSKSDSLVYTRPPVVTDKDIPEDERKRAAMFSDPVHTINIAQFIQYHLHNAIAQCGGPERFQEDWLVNVDKDVIKSFSELGIM